MSSTGPNGASGHSSDVPVAPQGQGSAHGAGDAGVAQQQSAQRATVTGLTPAGPAVVGPSPAAPADMLTSPEYHPERRRWRPPPIVRGVIAYLVLALVVGLLGGLWWHAAVSLPSYVVTKAGASTTEHGLTEFFATDAWYSVIGAVAGLLLGLLGRRLFHRLGWGMPIVVLAGANLAAMACWMLGERLGPSHFDERMSAAAVGESVPIDFQLHSHVAALVWVWMALLPVVLLSIFGHDAESGVPPRRWLTRRQPVVDDAARPASDVRQP